MRTIKQVMLNHIQDQDLRMDAAGDAGDADGSAAESGRVDYAEPRLPRPLLTGAHHVVHLPFCLRHVAGSPRIDVNQL